jgi:phage/plasmid-associated DNA primase/5S rRNA maturation endonuclease (ribonuclease M5)
MGTDVERIRRDVTLSDVVSRFGFKLVKDGGEYLACCPFHSEKTESCTFFTGDDGVDRYFCFGCGAKGDVLDFIMGVKGVNLPDAIRIADGANAMMPNAAPRKVEARDIYAGITPLETQPDMKPGRVKLYNPKRKGDRTEWGGFVPASVHRYCREDGSTFGYVLRHDLPDGSKETPMVMGVALPDGTRTWCRYPFPKPRPLYGLETLGDGGQVIIVEGEKCKDALARASGRTVVSWAGGTQGVKHTDWAPLYGRNVIVWYDNDGPGVATALEIKSILDGNGSRVRFLDLTKGEERPKGWDCADAIADGWAKAELDAFMRATVTDTPPAPWATHPPEAAKEEREPDLAPIAQEEPAPAPAAAPDVEKITAPRFPVTGDAARLDRTMSASPDDDLASPPAVVEDRRGVSGMAGITKFYQDLAVYDQHHMAMDLVTYIRAATKSRVIHAEGEFYVYNGRHWEVLPMYLVKKAVLPFSNVGVVNKPKTEVTVNSSDINGTVAVAQVQTADPEYFMDPTIGANTDNCTITLDDAGVATVRDHSEGDAFRFAIEAEFDPSAPGKPRDGTFLHKLLTGSFLGDDDAEEKAALLGEILGAAVFGLATRIRQPKAFVFLGETASNGKSTIAGLISILLPKGAVSSISPANLSDDARIINLAGKAANVADEISGNINGEAFKQAVTGDPMEGRDLYKSAFTFRPRAVHVFTTNRLPTFAGGMDRGIQRRMVVLKFERTIPDSEVIADILERIKRDEMASLLAFAVDGAIRLKRNGAYTVPKSSAQALQEWLQSDPLVEWFERNCERTEAPPMGGWHSASALYKDFKTWATEEGHRESFILSLREFSARLQTLPAMRKQRTNAGVIWKGVKLKTVKADDGKRKSLLDELNEVF